VEAEKFSATAKDYFERIISAANRMQNLIDALLNFSRTNTQDQVFEVTDLNIILNEVKIALKENIDDKQASFCY
jgi:light-regulated signal transduction histidine kinase (bacteriophytochrome)